MLNKECLKMEVEEFKASQSIKVEILRKKKRKMKKKRESHFFFLLFFSFLLWFKGNDKTLGWYE